ncbi:hypothetical protein QA635_33825 [Bradyrhizobium brasilense]|uniref:hypothetical protein n=1 Tax=Bradyrhizobium brasilense TaxID=1419277 RepID=UPI0024B07946|nr:hypothetical protein [Bradyrhizobium australafricanum]WFU31463.1 hypothetical protein QA635_33825 [Bradyrhizobium australafricanum]
MSIADGRPSLANGRPWLKRIAIGVVALGALGTAGYLSFRWVEPAPAEMSVAQQWNEAIARLGIEPVYPPQEDIAVGDVFVLITDDALNDLGKEPIAVKALKLWHLDLSAPLKQTYAEMYKFPETPDPPGDGKPWKFTSSENSIFGTQTTRGDLPLVLFPGFTIANTRAANIGANSTRWFGGAFGGSATSDITTEVRISAAESYGLPGLVAEAELIKFCTDPVMKLQCTDAEARKQMSIVVGSKIFDQVEDPGTKKKRPRYSVEIAMVSRVFLTRSMHTTIRRAGKGSASAAAGAVMLPVAPPPARPEENSAPAGAMVASGKTEGAVTGEMTKPASTSPGVTTSLQFGNSSVISTVDILQRPVAFGYRSVRWIPGDGT